LNINLPVFIDKVQASADNARSEMQKNDVIILFMMSATRSVFITLSYCSSYIMKAIAAAKAY